MERAFDQLIQNCLNQQILIIMEAPAGLFQLNLHRIGKLRVKLILLQWLANKRYFLLS